MTPRERIEAAIAGKPTDRLPFAFWYHFRTEPWFPPQLHPDYRPPVSEAILQTYIEGMCRAEYEFWHRYQPDLLKVMHDIPYEMPAELPLVEHPDQWQQLPRLEPDKGHFGAHLQLLQRLRERLPAEVPMIETVFNTFYYGNRISGGRLLSHLEQAPEAVQAGLAILHQNLLAYARAALAICDGIYYALSGASVDAAPRAVYERYFLPLDRALLTAVADAPMNVLHLHGYGELYADLWEDAPAAIVCWSDRACTLNLTEGKKRFRRCVMGGLNELELAHLSRERVFQQAQEALDQVGRIGFILAPGCALPTDINPELLFAIREFAERV
jgi:uroporphyrinogen decarboxylase